MVNAEWGMIIQLITRKVGTTDYFPDLQSSLGRGWGVNFPGYNLPRVSSVWIITVKIKGFSDILNFFIEMLT